MAASVIDSLILIMVTSPILFMIYGANFMDASAFSPASFIMNWLFPILAVVAFWVTKSATPGKLMLSMKVVDAKTGNTLTVGQAFGRYFGYFLSIIPFGLGLIYVAFDDKKQGFHDKIADTVVIRNLKQKVVPVEFEK